MSLRAAATHINNRALLINQRITTKSYSKTYETFTSLFASWWNPRTADLLFIHNLIQHTSSNARQRVTSLRHWTSVTFTHSVKAQRKGVVYTRAALHGPSLWRHRHDVTEVVDEEGKILVPAVRSAPLFVTATHVVNVQMSDWCHVTAPSTCSNMGPWG